MEDSTKNELLGLFGFVGLLDGIAFVVIASFGGIVWIIDKADSKFHENMDRDSKRRDRESKADDDRIDMIIRSACGASKMGKEQIPDMSDEELLTMTKAMNDECMRRWAGNGSARATSEQGPSDGVVLPRINWHDLLEQ